jgi:hypothetical protein
MLQAVRKFLPGRRPHVTQFGPIEIEKALGWNRRAETGTTAPWRYDAGPSDAIRPDDLRQTAILRFASWAAAFRNFGGRAPDADASLLKLPPPQIIFWAATPAPGLRPLV